MRLPSLSRWIVGSGASLLLWIAAASAQAGDVAQLAARLDAVLERHASTGAVIHARVLELPSRRELYARRIDAPCAPASNLKLVTSAAGLDMFGRGHAFKTWLAVDGDDLWLIGSGDPGTGDPRLAKAAGHTTVTMLEEWAETLYRRGIRRIAGDLVYYDGVLDEQRIHPAWYRSFLVHWYAAPVSGLNFNDNCVDITVFPSEEGQPAGYEVMPPVSTIKVINECITGKGSPSVAKIAGESTYKLTGGCSERRELMSKPVDDPGAFFAEALRTQLARRGIEIAGRVRRASAPLDGMIPPPASKIVATYETKITDVLSRINKNSQNMFADCLFKLTGRAFEAGQGRDVPGSWEAGAQAVRAFLKKAGIDDAKLVMMDGSGLSDRNRVTARMLTDLLAAMFARPDGEVYRESLSVCGVDGSLRDRMSGLTGRVYGKTGYIGGVSSVSGYVRTQEGRWLAFSFVYNEIPRKVGSDADTKPFTALQDEACAVLAAWPKINTTATTPGE